MNSKFRDYNRVLFIFFMVIALIYYIGYVNNRHNLFETNFTVQPDLIEEIDYLSINFFLKRNKINNAETLLKHSTNRTKHSFSDIKSEIKERRLYLCINNSNKDLKLIKKYLYNPNYTLFRSEILKKYQNLEFSIFKTYSKNKESLNYFLMTYSSSQFYNEGKSKLDSFLNIEQLEKEKLIAKENNNQILINKLENEIKFSDNKFNYHKAISLGSMYPKQIQVTSIGSLENNYNPNYNQNANPNKVYVKGYTKNNGTHVEPYIRTAPNKIKSDNLIIKY